VVAHEFVPDRPDRTDREAARGRLGLDPTAVVVAAVGSGAWRKGIDLFVAAAARVHGSVGDRARFVWVGSVDREDEVRHDMASLGVQDVVDLVGPTDDPALWFDAMDVLVLTSREDPFPLVVLEAGLAEVPVVSFDNGGAVEVLEPDAGVVVPYLDVEALADEVIALVEDPDRRARLGAALARRVRRDHVTRAGAPRMWEALTRP
jgi:glycosyltransferase involved in cell wall biosynthesis